MNVKNARPATKRKQQDTYTERFDARREYLTPQQLIVAEYIYHHRAAMMDKSAMEIAQLTGTSDATVIRTLQALGFSGLRELKSVLNHIFGRTLSSSARIASTVYELSPDINASIGFVVDSYRMTCDLLCGDENRDAIAHATGLLHSAQRIAIFGIGASALLADYVSRLFNRYGKAAYVLNRTGSSLSEQLIHLQPGDVLIMMVQRSPHREGTTVLEEARRLNIPIILLTGSRNSLFSHHADCTIFIPRSVAEERIPVHGTPMICLEVLVLALAAAEPATPIKTVNRLHELSASINRPRKKRHEPE